MNLQKTPTSNSIPRCQSLWSGAWESGHAPAWQAQKPSLGLRGAGTRGDNRPQWVVGVWCSSFAPAPGNVAGIAAMRAFLAVGVRRIVFWQVPVMPELVFGAAVASAPMRLRFQPGATWLLKSNKEAAPGDVFSRVRQVAQ